MLQDENFRGQKLFAFFGTDIEGYPDDLLYKLFLEDYFIIALDSKAIEYASKFPIPFTIITDWINTDDLLKIKDNAWHCEVNWFQENRDGFSINEICWPEIDHNAMHYFWLDALLSLRLSEIFIRCDVKELLLIDQNRAVPMVYYIEGSVCKSIWLNELKGRVRFIESKRIESPIQTRYIIPNHIKPLLYSPKEFLNDKIVFFASGIEIGRSKDLIQDLISSFPKQVVIMPNNINDMDLISLMNRGSIPVISPLIPYSEDALIAKNFFNNYQQLMYKSKGKIWEKILAILPFHFEYYCNYRWPKLNYEFQHYFINFSKYPPRLIIGAILNMTEWHIPILSAQQLGIKTLSIPHSISVNPSKHVIKSDLIFRFDFHLHIDKLSREVIKKTISIPENKFLPCNNCTDINSHKMRCLSPNYRKDVIKILVLFSPTSLYIYPTTQSRLIYPNKNPRKQIESIIHFYEISKDFAEKIDIKFKVHPGFSELELFNVTNKDLSDYLLPVDAELEPIIQESNLIIGVNFYSSALINIIKSKKPIVNYINDEYFQSDMERSSNILEILKAHIMILHSKEELKSFIMKILYNPFILEEMKVNITLFSEKYVNNQNFLPISAIISNFNVSKDLIIK